MFLCLQENHWIVCSCLYFFPDNVYLVRCILALNVYHIYSNEKFFENCFLQGVLIQIRNLQPKRELGTQKIIA